MFPDARLFLDTAFVQASLNSRDRYHAAAIRLLPVVQSATEVWTTEAVLVEVGNALSVYDRAAAVDFIEHCYRSPNLHVITVTTGLFRDALQLYATRTDKQWGLTDCISFVVMQEQKLVLALTADHHFIQAGYRALLLE
ncbi:MAG: PIN domain-containing protein [Anaerolineae bacterium]